MEVRVNIHCTYLMKVLVILTVIGSLLYTEQVSALHNVLTEIQNDFVSVLRHTLVRRNSEMDPCTSHPCVNGATCSRARNSSVISYRCVCPEMFEGIHCELNRDPCKNHKCANGASCVRNADGSFSYSCTCQRGYKGGYCEEEINACDSHPCKNGGTCGKVFDSFHCRCPDGFTDNTCATTLNVCNPKSNPCKNNGTCHVTARVTFLCSCRFGFEGIHCENKIDWCEGEPCHNGGSCVKGKDLSLLHNIENENGLPYDSSERFQCLCPALYEGKFCDKKKEPCAEDPCANDGICLALATLNQRGKAYSCSCLLGFSGPQCKEASSCEMKPCLNGATCTDTPTGFKCKCHHEWTGVVCQMRKTSCAEVPCLPSKDCEDIPGQTYRCFVRTADEETAIFKEETAPVTMEEDDNTSLIIGVIVGMCAILSVSAVGTILFCVKRQEKAEMKEAFYEKLKETMAQPEPPVKGAETAQLLTPSAGAGEGFESMPEDEFKDF